MNKEIEKWFNKLISDIDKACGYKSYDKVKKDYLLVKNTVQRWINNINEISTEESSNIHKIIDDIREKILFDKNIGDEKLISDDILISYEVMIYEINKERGK